MAFLSWEDKYSVGNQTIDRQHQRLVDLINELHSAMGRGEGIEYVGSVLNDLAEYTKYHFAEEEKRMAEVNFPGYEEHQEKHRKMTQRVLQLQQRYSDGERLTVEVLHFLKDWLTKHIMQTDKKYAPYLAESDDKTPVK